MSSSRTPTDSANFLDLALQFRGRQDSRLDEIHLLEDLEYSGHVAGVSAPQPLCPVVGTVPIVALSIPWEWRSSHID